MIMEGFMNFSLPMWLRRLIGRIITIIPAFFGVLFFGETCISPMMIFSQIVLSLQLPFAVFPLLEFTSDTAIMGTFANSRLLKISSYAIGFIIVAVNLLLIYFLLKGF
jgi:manganese transport protein